MGRTDEFYRSIVDLDKVTTIEATDKLSLGDRVMLILHNQAMIWDKLKELGEKKCCKD